VNSEASKQVEEAGGLVQEAPGMGQVIIDDSGKVQVVYTWEAMETKAKSPMSLDHVCYILDELAKRGQLKKIKHLHWELNKDN